MKKLLRRYVASVGALILPGNALGRRPQGKRLLGGDTVWAR